MLSDADKTLYGRQILLSELGLPGQDRLCAAPLELARGADPRARAVACEYLDRAGVGSRPNDTEPPVIVPIANTAEVRRVARDPELEVCAAWLLGCFAAVETIKTAAGVGTRAEFDPTFVLAAEVE